MCFSGSPTSPPQYRVFPTPVSRSFLVTSSIDKRRSPPSVLAVFVGSVRRWVHVYDTDWWVKLEHMGNRALFVSETRSLVMETYEGAVMKNRIYFPIFSSKIIYTSNRMARMVEDDIMRSQGLATIMAIGTANPPTFYDQSMFPDFYFSVTNSEDKTELKQKFQRLCNNSMIKKRYRHLTEDILEKYPNWREYKAPSLDARQDEMVVEVPKLGQEASENAIQEWGQPKSKITHLIFCTSCGVDMPGADYQLTNLLGLNPSVKRYMLYYSGCYAGGTGLRLAKDLAENSKGARILVVNCEITSAFFHGPSDTELDILVTMSLFGDGASATIVGSNPIHGVEKPLFEIVSATQMLIPDSGDAVAGHLRESGLMVHLKKDVPGLISKNIEKILVDSFQPLGVSDWNSIFWIAHPGGRAILDKIENELGLETKRLDVSRHVLSEFGNMSSATVVFVLDEMRKKSVREGLMTTGEGLEWGVLFGFGPGLTVETLVLHSISTQTVGSTIFNS